MAAMDMFDAVCREGPLNGNLPSPALSAATSSSECSLSETEAIQSLIADDFDPTTSDLFDSPIGSDFQGFETLFSLSLNDYNRIEPILPLDQDILNMPNMSNSIYNYGQDRLPAAPRSVLPLPDAVATLKMAPAPRSRMAMSKPKIARAPKSTPPRRASTGSNPVRLSAPATSINHRAQCACCQSTTTPMWREGPLVNNEPMKLCNACGIRWQKYGTCCLECRYVPRKQEKARGTCPYCQQQLPTNLTTRRRSLGTASAPRR
ncbi:uncharacterized protein MONBRDRAFT_33447 [Monosiga brevicollis MX1]|uniref:GATA-type domain-containing protein n=1 Tax=Monosiga brevicollis TaxID=81824 RepID=A9V5G3_MONBE|nr:uncharacterized protein MONBRDRAFT_33447 [Monosiga brevicollis MX1]EDQ87278.1 predicted protein [Monosiga brevicollis MX1]|eukprot:XP_001747891.1 hypothetical protein [Monosiga brevicollis MX1]